MKRFSIFAALTLAACAQDMPEEPVAWRITAIDGAPVAAGTHPTITFGPEGKLTGNAGCNRFGGRYTHAGPMISIDGPLTATRMACVDDAANAQEAKLFEILPTLTVWQSDKSDEVMLASPDGRSVRLEAAQSR